MKIFSKRLKVRSNPSNIFAMRRALRRRSIFCGIIFHSPTTALPEHLNYSLIFPDNFETENPDNPFDDRHWITRENDMPFTQKHRTPEDLSIYYKEGFLQIQTTIYLSFMEMTYAHLDWREKYTYYDFHVHLRRMPMHQSGEYVQRLNKAVKWAEDMVFISYLLPIYFLTYVSLQSNWK